MERKKLTKKRRWALGLAACCFLVVAAVGGGGWYMLDYALRPAMVDEAASLRMMREKYPQIVPWIDSLQAHQALRDTFIVAPDGKRLHALYALAPQATARTAVIVHGYTDKALEMLHIGYLYHKSLGYNILLPDLRYAGQSEGEAIQMGWLDRKDVARWIDEVPQHFGDSARVVVHGISMGAATTMMLSGDSLPDRVKCFVEDCGYTSVWDQFKKELKGQFGLPSFPLLNVASRLCEWRYGWNFTEASALEQVRRCALPMLFIHGDTDDYVPTPMVYEVYAAKSGDKDLWVSEGVDHAHSYKVYPELYTEKVRDFVEPYLQ